MLSRAGYCPGFRDLPGWCGEDAGLFGTSQLSADGPIKRPKLDAFTDQIDTWPAEDKTHPRKQHHTAKRIFDWLRNECGFTGGYTIVKDYVRTKKRGSKEMFVLLSHPPGHGQANFGETLVVIG